MLEALAIAARLVVQHHDLRAGTNLLVVAEAPALAADAAAVHAEPQAIRPPRRFGHAVVQVPDLQPAGVAPLNPFPINRIVPVVPCRKGFARPLAEPPGAMLAVTDAAAIQAAPTVVRDAFGMRPLDDLAQHVRQVLLIVGAVDARHVEVAGPVGLAAGVHGEPIRMGLVERFVGSVGIHASEHDQAILMGGTSQFAVEVAVAQGRRTVVQRELARVVGEDAPGVDDDALDLRAFPMLPPPGDVVARSGRSP